MFSTWHYEQPQGKEKKNYLFTFFVQKSWLLDVKFQHNTFETAFLTLPCSSRRFRGTGKNMRLKMKTRKERRESRHSSVADDPGARRTPSRTPPVTPTSSRRVAAYASGHAFAPSSETAFERSLRPRTSKKDTACSSCVLNAFLTHYMLTCQNWMCLNHVPLTNQIWAAHCNRWMRSGIVSFKGEGFNRWANGRWGMCLKGKYK